MGESLPLGIGMGLAATELMVNAARVIWKYSVDLLLHSKSRDICHLGNVEEGLKLFSLDRG